MTIVPTIAADAVTGRPWDVLVIGAGPAGALAARQAALEGARTLLIERKAMPRPKVCGACLNQHALAALDAAGLGALPGRLNAVPVRRFEVRSGRRRLELPLPGGVAVSRSALDTALVREAIAAGAEFLPETTARVQICPDDETREVVLTTSAGIPTSAQARLVLAADGLGHPSLEGLNEFASCVARGARLGIGTTVADESPDYSFGTIFMAVGRGGYAGLVRVEDGALNVAAALDRDYLKKCESPVEAFRGLLEEAGFPPVSALDSAEWHGTLPLTRTSRRVAGRRVLLLGDAVGYVEPFTGEGMAWALSAGAAVAPFVRAARETWSPSLERHWSAQISQLVRGRQRWCRLLAGALRHPWVVRSLVALVSKMPIVAEPVIRALNAPPRSLKVRPA